MKNNKSYMNSKHILSEGKLKALFKFLFNPKYRELILKQRSKLQQAVNKFNDGQDALESAYEKVYGKKLKTKKHITIKDLFR